MPLPIKIFEISDVVLLDQSKGLCLMGKKNITKKYNFEFLIIMNNNPQPRTKISSLDFILLYYA